MSSQRNINIKHTNFSTGLQPGEGLPIWKSETSDGPESHQNSNVPKPVAGLNGKQKILLPPTIENRVSQYCSQYFFFSSTLSLTTFFAPHSFRSFFCFYLENATFVSGLSQDFSIRQYRVGGRRWTEPLHWTRNRWTFPPTTRFIPCTVMGSASGRAVKLFVKTIKHSLSESCQFSQTLSLFRRIQYKQLEKYCQLCMNNHRPLLFFLTKRCF